MTEGNAQVERLAATLAEGLEKFDFVSASDIGVDELTDWLLARWPVGEAAAPLAPAGQHLKCPACGEALRVTGILGALNDELRKRVDALLAPAEAPDLNDEALLAAFVAGCNAENELNEAELSPQNVRKGVAAAMRAALRIRGAGEGDL